MANFDNPPLKPRRRPWWIAAAGLALLALAYSLFWFSVATKSRDAVVQWIDTQRANGFTVRHDSLVTSGFPFSIRLRFINPGFGAPHVRSPWGWEADNLNLMIKPWNVQDIRATTSGSQMLALALKGKTETFNGEAEKAELALRLSGGEPRSGHLLLKGIELKAETIGQTGISVAVADLQMTGNTGLSANHHKVTQLGATRYAYLRGNKTTPAQVDVMCDLAKIINLRSICQALKTKYYRI